MMTVDQILARHATRTSHRTYKPDPYKPRKENPFDVKSSYGKPRKPSDEFDVKEERERWGCVLPSSRGYSGSESGTKSVIRSMNDERRLSALSVRMDRLHRRDKLFRDFFVSNVMPRLMQRFNVDGCNPDYDWHNVPQPCMDTREAAWIEMLAYHKNFIDDQLKALIVAALRFTSSHGDESTDMLLSLNRCIKNRLVHAYHLVFGPTDGSLEDEWWRALASERKASKDYKPPVKTPPNKQQIERMDHWKKGMKPPFNSIMYTAEEMREQADYLQDIKLGTEAVMLRQAACYVEKYGPWKEDDA